MHEWTLQHVGYLMEDMIISALSLCPCLFNSSSLSYSFKPPMRMIRKASWFTDFELIQQQKRIKWTQLINIKNFFLSVTYVAMVTNNVPQGVLHFSSHEPPHPRLVQPIRTSWLSVWQSFQQSQWRMYLVRTELFWFSQSQCLFLKKIQTWLMKSNGDSQHCPVTTSLPKDITTRSMQFLELCN